MALIVLIAFVVAALLALSVLRLKYTSKGQEASPETAAEQDDTARAGPTNARRTGVDRMRAARLTRRNVPRPASRPQAESSQAADSGSESEEDEDEEEGGRPVKLTKKAAKKAAKEEAREAERAAREARERKTSAYDERRKKRDEERERQEQLQEEEARRAAEERQRAIDEEAAKWMGTISVDEEGTGDLEASEQGQTLLNQFVEYIKARKMVPLEELATEFKMRSSDVIDRIRGLEAMGRLTGLMDERGKYIFISPEEMKAVAEYIHRQGRVRISQLAQQSSSLVDLQPRSTMVPCTPGGNPEAVDFDSMFGGSLEEGLTAAG